MKAYLIQFTTKTEESNGYAIVAALTPNEANQILRTQGKYKYVQYNIVTTQILAEMCDCNGTKVLIEGIISGGDSAYKIAVKNGYSGTEEEWLESLRGPQGIIGPIGPAGQDGKDGENGKDGKDGITPDMSDYYDITTIDEKLKEIHDKLKTLDSITYPVITDLELSPSDTDILYSNQQSYVISAKSKNTKNGIAITPDSISIKLNGVPQEVTEDGDCIIVIDNPSIGEYTLTTEVTYGIQASSKTIILKFIQPCYYGCIDNEIVDSTIIPKLTQYKTPQHEITLNNPTEGFYLWIVLPHGQTMHRCECNNFDFPLNEPVTIINELGEFDCYRSMADLGLEAGDIPLHILYN